MGQLDGRTALVTGAARGERASLGASFAKALAAEGANVVLADIKDTAEVALEIEKMSNSGGGRTLSVLADVSDETQVQDMVAKAIDEFGSLEILVNNAAVGSNIPPIPVTEMTVEQWDALMAINVRGSFLCAKAVTPQMQKQKYGKIINIGSTTMMKGLTDRLHYVTAKGAILAMTRSLAAELGPDGIRVNTFAYCIITSQLNEQEFKDDPAREAGMLGARALRTHVRSEDLSGSIVYLASPASDQMTGQIMTVNAGDYFY